MNCKWPSANAKCELEGCGWPKLPTPPQCGQLTSKPDTPIGLVEGNIYRKAWCFIFCHWWQGFLYVFDQIKHASPGLTAGRGQLVAWRSAIFMEPVAVWVWNSMPRPKKSRYFLVIWHEHIHPSRPKYLLCLTLELQLQHRDVGGESRYNRNTLILVHTHFRYIILYSHSYKSEQLIPTSWDDHKSETGTTYHTPFPLILTPHRPWLRGFTHIQNCLGFYTTCYDTFIHLRDGSPCFTWNSSRVGRKAHGFPRKMMVDAQTFMCCLNHNVFPSYFTINAILVVWNVVDMFQPI